MQKIKRGIQGLLGRLGVYHRLKASILYDLYWSITDHQLIERRRKEIGFYRGFLKGFRDDSLIFDIGANTGMKADVFLRLGARVIAIEPDELNQKILREKFLKFRLRQKPVSIIGKAVSDKVASETMWIEAPGSALNTLSQKWVDALKEDNTRFADNQPGLDFSHKRTVETTTLEELMVAHGTPFFIKIDVEGYEAVVLRGLKRSVPFLSFEVNLPQFRPEGLECVKLLEQLSTLGRFNYSADIERGLALNEWVEADVFTSILERTCENTIEVFWRTVDANRDSSSITSRKPTF